MGIEPSLRDCPPKVLAQGEATLQVTVFDRDNSITSTLLLDNQ
jgi:hypothetical protein